MEETFEVVDAADRVVGQAPRSEVHARGLRHRAAHVLVFDRAGRLYLQRRALGKDCQPGLWDSSAAGHLQPGEAYAVGARRELAEELRIHPPAPLAWLAAIAAAPETGWEFIHVFTVSTDEPVQPDPVEIMDGRWLAPSGVTRWMAAEPQAFTGSLHLIWRHWQDRSARPAPRSGP